MFAKYFKDLKEIGHGRYSRIYKAIDIRNNKEVAIKRINKFDINSNYDYVLKCAKREIEITKMCQDDNIVKFYEAFESENYIVLILELCEMTFEDYGKECSEDLYLFQKFLIGLNNALKEIRKKKIMHRDIKPENIFIKEKNGEYIPKLGDFGISRFYSDDIEYDIQFEHDEQRYTGSIGTYYFIAPEIIKLEPYNHLCDLFSLGITLYITLFLTTPYGPFHSGLEHKFKNIIYSSNKLNLIKTGIQSLDNLLENILELDPKKRISFEE